MKTGLYALMAMAGLMGFTGCQHLQPPTAAPLPPSPEARAAMQTNLYTGSYDTVYSATIAVLQDLGWRLDTVDKAGGIIRASTVKRLEALGPEEEKGMNLKTRVKIVSKHADISRKWSRWHEVIIHTEPWGADRTRQRIVMNLRGTQPAMSYLEEQGGKLFVKGRTVMINAPPEEQTVEVAVPEAYRDFFERIEKAVRLRQSPAKTPAAPASEEP